MNVSSSNIDREEVAKFEALANRWWDPWGEFKPLHDINPLRLGYVQQRSGLTGKRVVDVGCGGGVLAEAMARAGAEVVGIDPAEAAISVAQLHATDQGVSVDYRAMTAEILAAQEPGSFDIVTCMEMLEHVPDPQAVVKACAQLVKPGGQLFFSTLSQTPRAFLFAIVGAEYLLRLLPRGTHQWQKFIRPSTLDRYARHAQLSLQHLQGLHYNPVTRHYWLGPGVEVNYLAHYQPDLVTEP